MKTVIITLILAGCGATAPQAPDRSYFEPSASTASAGLLCGCTTNYDCLFSNFGCPNAGFTCERMPDRGGFCAPIER